jgi:hypothetical protein
VWGILAWLFLLICNRAGHSLTSNSNKALSMERVQVTGILTVGTKVQGLGIRV